MSEPILYEVWTGPVWVSKFDRCQADTLCARPNLHDGSHADISLSGIVLRTWEDPNLTEDEIDVIGQVHMIRDELLSAIETAEMQLRNLAREKTVRNNLGLRELVERAQRDSTFSPEDMGLSDDESNWDADIEELKAAATKRTRRAA